MVEGNRNLNCRMESFPALPALSAGLSFLLGILIGILDTWTGLDFGPHVLDGFADTYSPAFVIMAAVFLAPVLEKLVFRWPMVFFRDSLYFNYIFYSFTPVFGFYHLFNFQVTIAVLVFSPILVAPQIAVGAILGYLRVQFGLPWAILLHACYNLLLIGPLLLLNQEQINTL